MNNTIISFCFIAAVHFTASASDPYHGEKCIIKSEFIFRMGEVSFPSCHASTIIEKHNGLIAAWFGGTEERDPDVGIWMSHYSDGKWTKPIEVANGIQHKSKRYPTWNPVLFNTGSEILLFYKTGPSPSKWWGELIRSNDEGMTWSNPNRLPEDIYGPIKNKPVLLKNNVLLCPSSTEDQGWRVHMEFTSDNGVTWERTPALNDRKTGVIQPTLLQHRNGRLQMLCRSTVSYIMSSYSDDNGHTWSTLKSTGLPNPNSGIDAVTLKDGRFLVVYNHIFKGRNILNISVSDNGIEWKAAALAENEPEGGEFSYPAVIQTSDGLVHITYTWNRELIKHLVIDPGKIEAKPFADGGWPEK
jgi:predicted neuraminidase